MFIQYLFLHSHGSWAAPFLFLFLCFLKPIPLGYILSVLIDLHLIVLVSKLDLSSSVRVSSASFIFVELFLSLPIWHRPSDASN